MATKPEKYKVKWLQCQLDAEWELPLDWEIISVVQYTQTGQILALLRYTK